MAEWFGDVAARALQESKRIRREREMTKPDDMPQDVWDAAGPFAAETTAGEDFDTIEAMSRVTGAVRATIARAIMAERNSRDAVWASAASYGDGSPMFTPERLRESIADMMAAIAAEREACALVAEASLVNALPATVDKFVGAAIRNRT